MLRKVQSLLKLKPRYAFGLVTASLFFFILSIDANAQWITGKTDTKIQAVAGWKDSGTTVDLVTSTDQIQAGLTVQEPGNYQMYLGSKNQRGMYISTSANLNAIQSFGRIIGSAFLFSSNNNGFFDRDQGTSVRIQSPGVEAVHLRSQTTGDLVIVNGSTGAVQFTQYGAGTLTTDASGNITATSDARLKDLVGSFSAGLNALKNIQPMRYFWRTESGLDTEHEYAGFVAQNVEYSIPEAVNMNKNGFLSLNTVPILAAAVNAINEQQRQIEKLQKRIADFEARIK